MSDNISEYEIRAAQEEAEENEIDSLRKLAQKDAEIATLHERYKKMFDWSVSVQRRLKTENALKEEEMQKYLTKLRYCNCELVLAEDCENELREVIERLEAEALIKNANIEGNFSREIEIYRELESWFDLAKQRGDENQKLAARVVELEGVLRRVHAQFTSHGDDRMIMPKDSLMFEDIEKALGGEE